MASFTIREVAAKHQVDLRTLARAMAHGVEAIRGEAVRRRVIAALRELHMFAADNAPTSGRHA